jgi:diaminohydroxyphosphoribosylaminopyrimidine deaminase / 5-amino-6-(5-phosphoribosylamino)uracil reductase
MLLHFSITFGACKMDQHEKYMHRCLQLAKLAEGHVAPNPMVGSVLVHDNKIIGEGYHMQFGQPHAEVNCIRSIADENKHLIDKSTLYASLEPCAHYGKTPPCADLIITYKIPKVVIGCRDPFAAVDGKGIEKLRAARIHVTVGVLESECKDINKRFFTFHVLRRPFILLKWAETINHKIGKTGERLLVSSEMTNRFVHQLRAQQQAILVGTNTVLADDPQLDVRLAAGSSPVRLIIDLENKLPRHLKVFNDRQPTIIFNYYQSNVDGQTEWYELQKGVDILHQIMEACYQKQIQSILVEGGAKTLQSFIDAGLWDEAIVIQNKQLFVADGIDAPHLHNAELLNSSTISTDLLSYYFHQPAAIIAH